MYNHQNGGCEIMKRSLYVGASFLLLIAVLAIGSAVLGRRSVVQAAGGGQAPRFEVDPMWPKPLPNHWVMGNALRLSAGAPDHVWMVHRRPALERMGAV